MPEINNVLPIFEMHFPPNDLRLSSGIELQIYFWRNLYLKVCTLIETRLTTRHYDVAVISFGKCFSK